ncbi:SMI1/KNR4 family protein [Exiguobacterium indicum]|uniref:SMI1/KNR4 family protein n=1 Tax=Exiguobacterium indicum TaxID=296995 RepID=A0ABU8ELH7_9BACL
MNTIQSIFQVLRKKIEHGSTYVQRSHDEHGIATFQFDAPASVHQISEFERRFSQKLPHEYVDFLTIHNGSELFILGDGRGTILFPLEKVQEETLRSMEEGMLSGLKDEFWVIGEMNDGAILINRSTMQNSKDTPYMEWCYAVGAEGMADPIGQNFKDFLKYVVISQGDMFWEWTSNMLEDDDVLEADLEGLAHDVSDTDHGSPYDEVEMRIEYPYEEASPYRVKILGSVGREKTVLSSFEWDGDFLRVLDEISDELDRWEIDDVPIDLVQYEARSLIRGRHPRKERRKYIGTEDFLSNPPKKFSGR